MENKPTPEIIKAMEHIQSLFPKVVYVTYGIGWGWRYSDEDLKAPQFTESNEVDIDLLEKAADSVECLPCIFYIPKK